MITTLAAIGLLLPAMLGGVLLVSLPIAAHLLNRKAQRKLVFPSLVLLSESSASQSQLFKLRRWLLLLLRCMAVLLVVLAFAQPIWRTGASAAAGGDGPSAVVLVIDLSASADQRVGGVSTMQAVRGAAERAIDSLRRGADKANIVIADARPHAIFPAMTANLAAIRAELGALAVTQERADLAGALALAGRLLAEHEGDRRVVIVSDMQRSNWQALVDAGKVSLPKDTAVFVVPVVERTPANVGLSEPKLEPRSAVIGQRCMATVVLSNGADEPKAVRVAMSVDGKLRDAQTIQLQPNQKRQAGFAVRFDKPSDHRITFSIGDDALDADNRAHMIATIRQRVPVVVIADDAANQPGSGSYFITRALAPRGDRRDRFEVRHLTSDAIDAHTLGDAAAVVLGEVGTLDRKALGTLHAYLNEGGGVVVFAGGGPAWRNLQAWDGLAEDGVLPWKLGGRRDLAASGALLTIGDAQWRSAVLRDFDESTRTIWQRIAFRQVWAAGDIRADAQVLMRFSDGTPALGDRSIGAGRVILASFSPSLADSELGKFGTFVAMMHSMVREVQGQYAPSHAGTVGESLMMKVVLPKREANPGVVVYAPDDKPQGDLVYSGEARRMALTIDRPAQAGFYRAEYDRQVLAIKAVNIDPRESDLRRIDTALVEGLFDHAASADPVASKNAQQDMLGLHGKPLWGWALAAALAFMALELSLLSYWRR